MASLLNFARSAVQKVENIPQDVNNDVVKPVVNNVVTPTVNSVKNAGDVVNALRQGVTGIIPAIGGAITHNPLAENNAVAKTNAAMNYSLNASRGLYTPAEANSRSFSTSFVKPLARATATYAPYALGPETASLAGPEAGVAARLAISGGAGAGVNAASTAGSELANGQKIDLAQIAKSGALGAGMGVAGQGVSEAKAAVPAIADNIKANPLNEIGAIGKNVKGGNFTHDENLSVPKVQKALASSRPDLIQEHGPVAAIAPNKATNNMGYDVTFKDGQTAKDVTIPHNMPTKATPAALNRLESLNKGEPVTPSIPGEKPSPAPLKNSPKTSLTPEAPKVGAGQGSGLKETKFTGKSIPKSDEVSAPVKEQVSAQYKPGSNAEKLATSGATVSSGLDKATEQVNSALGKSRGTINAQEVSDAIATAKAHDAAGNVDTATEIYNKLADHLTAAGQTVQAASLLSSRSPEGLRNAALSALQKGGANVTDELKGKVQDAYTKIKAAPEGSNQRAFAVQDLQKVINNNVKQGKVNQAFTLWRTGLLTGPLTATKVAVSHAILNTAEKVKDIPAVALDKTISGASRLAGKGPMRSTALTLHGTGKGTVEGLQAAGQLLGHGHDTPGTSGIGGSFDELGKPTVTYGNSPVGKAANFYTQKVGQVHASIPKPFYMAAKENDLNKQADAAAINQGLKGSERAAFVKKFTTNPAPDVGSEADLAGQKAAFQQPSFLGKQAQALQRVPGGRGVLPFAKIAATILTDVKDYSPVGAAQSIFDAAKASKNGWSPIIQKQLVEGVGRGITGTAVVALGAELAKKGDITTNYPTDKKEQALWQAEGKQENSILVDGKWRQTPSLGPFASLLQAGAYYQESKGNNPAGKSNATAAITGAISNFSSQSYLSGLTSVAGAVQNPTENLGSTAKLEAGSIIPTGVAQVAAAGDKETRTTQNAGQAIESKIPGLREHLPVAQTQFGQPIANPDHGIIGVTDPTKPTNAQDNQVTNELQRLVGTVGTSATPVPQAVLKVSGTGAKGVSQSVPLSKVQQAQFTAIAGPQIHQAMSTVINTPGYKALDDNSKAAALTNAKTLTENAVKTQTFNQLSSNPKGNITNINPAINNNVVASAAVQKAKVAADKASFTTSNKSFATIDGTVFTKDAAGNVTSTPLTTYQYNLGTAQLTQEKDEGNLQAWNATAQNQLSLIQKQLNDPSINVDPLQVTKLQNEASTIQTDIAKYQSYGGFKSSSSGSYGSSSSSLPKVQNYKTSGGSTIKAPKVKTITAKGPKGAFKSPKVAKAKSSVPSKISVKGGKSPKAPAVGLAKVPKLAPTSGKKSQFGEA